MTNTSEKLYAIIDKLEDNILQFEREKQEDEDYLAYAKRACLLKSTSRDELISLCKDFGIDGTRMSNDKMADEIMDLPHYTRTIFCVDEELHYSDIDLLNQAIAYQRSSEEEDSKEVEEFIEAVSHYLGL